MAEENSMCVEWMDGWMHGLHISAPACVSSLSSLQPFSMCVIYTLTVLSQYSAADHEARPVGGGKKAFSSFWPWN